MIESSEQKPVSEMHARFLQLLPRLQLHGRIFFRNLPLHKKEEAIAENDCLGLEMVLSADRA